MSWNLVSEPIQPNTDRVAATYQRGGLTWVWKDSDLITGKSDSSGLLQVDISSGQAARLSQGDYVYLTILENHPQGASPFVTVNTVSLGSVVVNFPYEVLSAETEELRFVFDQDFTLETGSGIAASPTNTIPYIVKPDKQAFYTLDAKRAVVSRFDFEEPSISLYADSVANRAYPTGETPPSLATGLKQNVGADIGEASLFWKDVQNLFTTRNGDFYETQTTAVNEQTIIDGSTTTINTFIGNTIKINFDTPIPDIDLAPVTLPDGFAFFFDGGGNNALGIQGTSTTDFDTNFLISNNAVTITYEFVWTTLESLEPARETCEDAIMIAFWDYTGGWKQYSFQNRKEYSLDSKSITSADSLDDNYISAYTNAFESIDLYARPESETVVDFLNRLLISTQIFQVMYDSAGNITEYRRMFSKQAKGTLKVNPFNTAKNLYRITLTYSEKLLPINED